MHVLGVEPARRRERQRRHRDDQRSDHRDGDGEREVGEELRHRVAHEHDGKKDNDRGDRAGEQRRPDLLRAGERGFDLGQAALALLGDGLEHDDGGVERLAHAESESGERDDVERASERVEHHQRDGEADRDRQADQQRGAPVAHEIPEHAHRQQDAGEQVAGDHVDGLVDEHRRVERLRDRQADLLELVVAQRVDLRLDRRQRVENVGVVLFHDLDADGRIAVLQREIAAIAAPHLHRGDVAEPHRPAVAPLDHQVRELLHRIAAGESHRVLAAADVDEATRDVIGAAGHLRDARNLDAELGRARRVEHDLQLFLRAEVDAHVGDAGNRLDAVAEQLFDLAAVVVDGARGAGQQLHEEPRQRVVGAVAAVLAERDLRRLRIARQRRQLIHAADDFEHRRLHVGADRELQVDERAARVGEGIQRLHAAQARERPLLRLDDLGFDLGGRGRAPAREDRDDRLFDVREQLDR